LLLLSFRYKNPKHPELGAGAILEISRCWLANVINLPFLQPPGFESYSHWSVILSVPFLQHFGGHSKIRPPHPIGQGFLLPDPVAYRGSWSQEVHTSPPPCDSRVSFQMAEEG
jgi:hypothetical protein